MAKEGHDVTVMVTGQFNSFVFGKLKNELNENNIRLLNVPEVPVSVGKSPSVSSSYAVYRFLTTPGNNVYSVIYSPSHSGLMYYTLKARSQGLACFANTRFASHLDSLPSNLLMRMENNDMNGSGLGVVYGQNTEEIAEMSKIDFMAQKVVEMSDAVVSNDEILSDYVVNELKWNIDAERLKVAQFAPYVSSLLSQAGENAELIELVFVGTPYLSQAAGIKTIADSLDLLKAKIPAGKPLKITFLGQSVELTSPKLLSEEFLDLRSYLWPTSNWEVVSALNVADVVAYFGKSSGTKKVAVIPHLVFAAGSSQLVQTLIANEIPVVTARNAMTESMILYDDWDFALFQNDNAKSLADRLASIIKNGPENVAVVHSSSSMITPKTSSEQWTKNVFAPLFEDAESSKTCSSAGRPVLVNDNDMPLVSVVIVHHDRPELVKQALASLESQDYPQDKLEVILVDDGSTNPEAVQFINDLAWQWWETKGWKVVREPQRWLGAARNTGVRYAKGKYVIFVDDDDVSKSHKVSTLVQAALATDADVVTAGHDLFRSTSYPQTVKSAAGSGRFVPLGSSSQAGMFENVFGDSSFLVKKSFFLDIGGFTEDFGVGFEDYEFLAKVSLDQNAKLEAVPESLTWYRKLYNGKSMTDNTELKENQARMMRPYVEKYPFQNSFDQSFLRYAQNQLFARSESPFSQALLNTTVHLTSTIQSFTFTSVIDATTTESTTGFTEAPTTTESVAVETTTQVVVTTVVDGTSTEVFTTTVVSASTETLTNTDVSSATTAFTTAFTSASTDSSFTTQQPTTAVTSGSSTVQFTTSFLETTSSQDFSTTQVQSTQSPSKTSSIVTTEVLSTSVPSRTTSTLSNTLLPTPTHPVCNTQVDACGVCGGDSSSCKDCAGVIRGNARRDNCGICNGDNTQCFKILTLVPHVVPADESKLLAISGAGFQAGDQVKINNVNIPAARTTVVSPSLIAVNIDASVLANLVSDSQNLGTAEVSLFNSQSTSNTVPLTVYKNGGSLSSVTPLRTQIERRDVFTLSGSGLLNFTSAACFFRYQVLTWNSDFTRQILVDTFQTSPAVFVDSATYRCNGPFLSDSALVSVELSYSGVSADFVTVGQTTVDFRAFASSLYVAKSQKLEVIFEAPAPVVTRTEFDNTGFFIRIEFNAAVNYQNFTTCSSLFVVSGLDESVYSKLSDGNPNDCQLIFTGPRSAQLSVRAEFAQRNPTSAPLPGKLLKFVDSKLKRANQQYAITLSGDSLPIAAPLNPVAPIVNIMVPSYLGVCSDLKIDISSSGGSGGRYYTSASISATVSEASTSIKTDIETALVPLLNTFSDEITRGSLFVNIPATAFPSQARATVTITVALTNFLGASGQKTFTFFLDTNTLIPAITISGPSGNVAERSRKVRLVGQLSLPHDQACLTALGISSAGKYNLSWSAVSPAEASSFFKPEFVSTSGSELIIPAYAYPLGGPYTFAFDVKNAAGESFLSTYDVTYQYGSLSSQIAGGSRTVGNTEDLIIEAEIIDGTWKNARELLGALSDYTFSWSCTLVDVFGGESPCYISGTQNPITIAASQKITLEKDLLATTGKFGSYYSFTVNVVHVPSGRSSSSSASYRLVDGSVPTVSLDLNKKNPLKSDSSFAISASVKNVENPKDLIYTWASLDSCNGEDYLTVDLNDESNLNVKKGTNVLAFNTTKPALRSAASYCIQLQVQDPSNPENVGSAQISFTTRAEPDFGTCEVVGNRTGYALSSEITFSCSNWATDPESGDVFYRYFFPGNGDPLAAGPRTKNGIKTVVFGATGPQKVLVEITDEAGGQAREPFEITVEIFELQRDLLSSLEIFQSEYEQTSNVEFALIYAAASVQLSVVKYENRRTSSLVKRQDEESVVQFILNFIKTLSSQTTLDYVDIGPTVVSLLNAIVSGGTITPELAYTTVSLVRDLAAQMNADARKSGTCFTPTVATQIFRSYETVLVQAQGISGFDASDLLATREPILKVFTSCLARATVCGGLGSSVNSESTSITYGQVTAGSDSSSLGIFNVSDISSAFGTSDCVQYRFDSGVNFLGPDANGTIGSQVFALEFSNATINAGGPDSETSDDTVDVLKAKFDPPIVFNMPIDSAQQQLLTNTSKSAFCSFYVHTSLGGFWSTDGCTSKVIDTTTVQCTCNHLTEFAISVQSSAVQPGDEPETPNARVGGNGPSIIAPVAAAIIGFIVVGIVGIATYRRYEKKVNTESHRVGLADESKVPHLAINQMVTARTDAVVEETTDTEPQTPSSPKTRNAASLPPYQLPPSYDDHVRVKSKAQ